MTVSMRGLKATATRAGATVEDMGDGWHKVIHPITGNILQRDDKGYLGVHTRIGSWSEGANSADTIKAIWRGDL